MITYDEPKRLRNIAKHGYDFADLEESFFDDAVVVPAKAKRFIAINEFRGRVVTVVLRRSEAKRSRWCRCGAPASTKGASNE